MDRSGMDRKDSDDGPAAGAQAKGGRGMPARAPRSATFDAAADEEAAGQTGGHVGAQAAARTAATPETARADPLEPADRPAPRTHRRRPGLALPLVMFIVLLLAGAAVGQFVVPAGGPQAGSPPNTQPAPDGLPAPAATTPEAPSSPNLPTPPARPANLLAAWAERVSPVVDVPVVAIQAYGYAQLMLRQTDPACNLSWTTLAGIGEVVSRHGQADGSVLESTGRSSPPIMGPLLDGKAGRARVDDTDAGAFDGDATFDRTMGPLHVPPTAWRTFALDADADAIVDPYDIDDAALAVARLLCSGGDDLSRRKDWDRAVARHQPGGPYLRAVFDAADGYGQRTKDI